jgi:hypothetical protein
LEVRDELHESGSAVASLSLLFTAGFWSIAEIRKAPRERGRFATFKVKVWKPMLAAQLHVIPPSATSATEKIDEQQWFSPRCL